MDKASIPQPTSGSYTIVRSLKDAHRTSCMRITTDRPALYATANDFNVFWVHEQYGKWRVQDRLSS
jgi:hypothetical protein